MPLLPNTAMTTFTIPAAVSADGVIQARQITCVVTPGHAEAVGLRLQQGRLFNEGDVGAGIRPMVVNDEFVRRYFPNARDRPALQESVSERSPMDTEIIGLSAPS